MKKTDGCRLKPKARQHIRELILLNINKGATGKATAKILGVSTGMVDKILIL